MPSYFLQVQEYRKMEEERNMSRAPEGKAERECENEVVVKMRYNPKNDIIETTAARATMAVGCNNNNNMAGREDATSEKKRLDSPKEDITPILRCKE